MIPAPTRETWIPFAKDEIVPNLPTEFTGDPIRHLMYHIWPAGTTRRWQWNVAELKKRIELFNGLRIVGIAVDENTATAEYVVQEFGDTRIDYWYVTKNDPVLGEMSKRTFRTGTCPIQVPNALRTERFDTSSRRRYWSLTAQSRYFGSGRCRGKNSPEASGKPLHPARREWILGYDSANPFLRVRVDDFRMRHELYLPGLEMG